MKKILNAFLFFVIAFSTQTFFSQTSQPTATPPIENDDEVVKVSTSLVQLDVVVTDKKGNQITDLSPEDFEIYVNGKKQDISNFSYIFSKTEESEDTKETKLTKAEKKKLKYSVPPPPSKLKLEKVRRTYALVVDDLGLSFPSVPYVKDTLKKFIREQMQEGDLVAIVRTGSGIGALQSFTTDKDQLLAAVNKIRWNPQGRGGAEYFSPIQKTLKEEIAATSKSGDTVEGAESDTEFENANAEFRNENFSIGTLGGVSYVIRGMRELPGRKAVMLFTEGFSLVANNQPTQVFDAMRRIADLANRSSVVIYTLDPRGLQVPGMANAGDDITNVFVGGAGNAEAARSLRESGFLDSQQSLRFLAYETGGLPFVNNNNLQKGLKKAIEDQSGYYLIGYEPDEGTFDPKKAKFNKVKINVNREGLKVRYRSGFFGIPDSKIAPIENKTPGQQIYGALSSPFSVNDISLSLNTLFAEGEKKKMYLRSLVTIDANNLKFTKGSDETYTANFDILAVTFGDNGKIVDESAKNYSMKLGEKAYRRALEKGVIYDLLIPVKKSGAYQFRVALRDSATSKVGSASQFIRIPNLRKKRLAISSILLDNYTVEQLQQTSSVKSADSKNSGYEFDTAQRRFKRGTMLRYDYVIYNAKTKPLDVEVQAKLYRDGKLFLQGTPKPIDTKGQKDLTRIESVGAITLGRNLAVGNYVLQIIATDKRSKRKYQNASRWIDFDIIE